MFTNRLRGVSCTRNLKSTDVLKVVTTFSWRDQKDSAFIILAKAFFGKAVTII